MLAPAEKVADPDRAAILRAKAGDEVALGELWVAAVPVARRRAQLTAGRYAWLDSDDVENFLLSKIPDFIRTFNPDNEQGNPWKKYCYFRMVFMAKDFCRKEDPLGIGYPQKKQYPEWYRLGDEAFNGREFFGREAEPSEVLADGECTNEDLAAVLDEIREAIPERLRKKTKRRVSKKRKRRTKVSEQVTTPETVVETVVEETPAATPERKGWPKGKPRGKQQKKKAPSATQQPTAMDQIALAAKFAKSCGGIGKAITLLESLRELRA